MKIGASLVLLVAPTVIACAAAVVGARKPQTASANKAWLFKRGSSRALVSLHEFSRLNAAVATKGARPKGPRRLIQPRILACGIGPAQRGRQNDVHLAANHISGLRAELERFEPPAEHGELIDRLRALVTAAGDTSREPIVGLRCSILAEPHVLRSHRDLDRLARLDVRRHQRREALAARLDGAEFAVARQHAASEQIR